MSKVVIYEEVESDEELVDLLDYIKGLVDQGFTSGYYPGWELQD